MEVHVDDAGRTLLAGIAYFTRHRGAVSTTFTYDPEYLAHPRSLAIDPQLHLVSGAQHVQGLPGAFSDGAPDRWGRSLIEKREREVARAQQRRPRTLDDVDFLLGVHDDSRQGALRYRERGGGRFLDQAGTIPRTVALPRLLRASDEAATADAGHEAIKVLLDAGTGSLGGARPKATVLLDDGALGLAKFPHAGDEWNVMAWEYTALEIAAAADLRVPERQLVPVDDRHVLLLRRFDRTATGHRLGYMSTMTMMNRSDGEYADYVDIAMDLADFSAALSTDRAELFTRVVLSVAIGNTDDHLRNHGLLRSGAGWQLSPVFDINANPRPAERRTSIAGATSPGDEATALLDLAEACSLSRDDAAARIARVIAAARTFDARAQRIGVQQSEIAMMRDSIAPRLEALTALLP